MLLRHRSFDPLARPARSSLLVGANTMSQNGGKDKLVSSGESPVLDYVPALEATSSEGRIAGGAPDEGSISPLGQHVGWVSVVALNLSQMIGTGIFSTPGSISKNLGSVGASILIWVVGIILSFAGLAVYTELASYYPTRAGAEVVYLEKAYRKPRYLLPVTFALQTVLLSFSSSNAVVFASYSFASTGHKATEWQAKGVACAAITAGCLATLLSTKWSLRLCNVISYVKLLVLVFVAVTGLVVLGGGTRVKDPHANFRNAFQGTSSSGNAWATALVKIVFSFTGWNNANNVLNEIENPVRTLRLWSPITLAVVSVLYVLAAVSYFAAVPIAQIKSSSTLAAALFFKAVFGESAGARVLPGLVAVSAMGNIIAVIIGQARILREVGRQGVLPWPEAWASTRPFGTPLLPLAVKWGLSVLMILAPPFGDAFNFIVDLASYPAAFFVVLLCIGLFLIRRQRKRDRTPEPSIVYRAWFIAPILYGAQGAFLLIAPWIPPTGGATGGDVSFWYATYCAVGLGVLLACAVYWTVYFVLLPKWRSFSWEDEVVELPDGTKTNRLVKRRNGTEL